MARKKLGMGSNNPYVGRYGSDMDRSKDRRSKRKGKQIYFDLGIDDDRELEDLDDVDEFGYDWSLPSFEMTKTRPKCRCFS